MNEQRDQMTVSQIPDDLVRYNALMARALKQLKELEAERDWRRAYEPAGATQNRDTFFTALP